MQTIPQILHKLFKAALKELYPDLNVTSISIDITRSTQDCFGHYQCNSAMKLASCLKLPPRIIAQSLSDHVIQNGHAHIIDKMDIAGPGFINIHLSQTFLQNHLHHIDLSVHFGIQSPSKQKIIIDFSSPNVAKEMHVGHLRSTIIGDCLANLHEFLGHNVLRINHIGDWGTQFGMLIHYIQTNHLNYNEASLTDLMAYYKASKIAFDNDPIFKEQAKERVVRLQNGNTEEVLIWKTICAISSRAYQDIYNLLNIRLTERGESFYNPFLKPMIKDLDNQGLLKDSDAAKCLFLDGFRNREGQALPMILQKSDGGFNYASTDLAALRHRITEDRAERIIYVTDMGQKTHFQMLFAAAKQAQYCDDTTRLEHVPFGLVLGPDGKKFKTRSGETEKLIDLINKSIQRSETIFKERQADWSEEKIKAASKILGINAIKYADLSTQRTMDYRFSYERMLQFEGNTAAFLLYAYVRMASIQRKSTFSSHQKQALQNAEFHIEEESESKLALHICRFQEVLCQLERDLCPHILCEYLYDLAQIFNQFFRDCRVINHPKELARLRLCQLSSKILRQGMQILGLEVLEEM